MGVGYGVGTGSNAVHEVRHHFQRHQGGLFCLRSSSLWKMVDKRGV